MRSKTIMLFICTAIGLLALEGQGQDSSLYNRRSSPLGRPYRTAKDSSMIYVPVAPPEEIRKHRIITVRVDASSQMFSEGEVKSRKTLSYNAELLDWIKLVGLKAIKPAPQSDGDPTIAGALSQLNRSDGELETRENIKFDIPVQVVDVKPNGNLVLEGHRRIRPNGETWEISLSGMCRPEDIGPGNLLLSKNILNMDIYKRESGQIRDSYRRGWFSKWFDRIAPF